MAVHADAELERVWRRFTAPHRCPRYIRRIRVGARGETRHNALCDGACACAPPSALDWQTWHLDLPTNKVVVVRGIGTRTAYAETQDGEILRPPHGTTAPVAVAAALAATAISRACAGELASYRRYLAAIAQRAPAFGLAAPVPHDELLWRLLRPGAHDASVWVSFQVARPPVLTLIGWDSRIRRRWTAQDFTSFMQEAADALVFLPPLRPLPPPYVEDRETTKLLASANALPSSVPHSLPCSADECAQTDALVAVPRASVVLSLPSPTAGLVPRDIVVHAAALRLAPYLPSAPPPPAPNIFAAAVIARSRSRPGADDVVAVMRTVYALAYGDPLPPRLARAIAHLASTLLRRVATA